MSNFLTYLCATAARLFLMGMLLWSALLVLPQAQFFGNLLFLTEGARAFPSIFLICSGITLAIIGAYGFQYRRGDSVLTLLAICFALGFQIRRAPEFYLPVLAKPAQVSRSPALSIVVANVELGRADGKRLFLNLQNELPDVLVVTEITPSWIEQSNVRSYYPHRVEYPDLYAAGTAIYTKRPLKERAVRGAPDFFNSIVATLNDEDGQEVWLIAVHAPPPSFDLDLQQREKYFQLVSELRQLAPIEASVVVAGDFNATPFSESFKSLLARERFVDAAAGMFLPSTWQHKYVGAFLDHVLLSGYSSQGSFRVLDDFGSDHFPVSVKLFPVSDISRTKGNVTNS